MQQKPVLIEQRIQILPSFIHAEQPGLPLSLFHRIDAEGCVDIAAEDLIHLRQCADLIVPLHHFPDHGKKIVFFRNLPHIFRFFRLFLRRRVQCPQLVGRRAPVVHHLLGVQRYEFFL